MGGTQAGVTVTISVDGMPPPPSSPTCMRLRAASRDVESPTPSDKGDGTPIITSKSNTLSRVMLVLLLLLAAVSIVFLTPLPESEVLISRPNPPAAVSTPAPAPAAVSGGSSMALRVASLDLSIEGAFDVDGDIKVKNFDVILKRPPKLAEGVEGVWREAAVGGCSGELHRRSKASLHGLLRCGGAGGGVAGTATAAATAAAHRQPSSGVLRRGSVGWLLPSPEAHADLIEATQGSWFFLVADVPASSMPGALVFAEVDPNAWSTVEEVLTLLDASGYDTFEPPLRLTLTKYV